MRWTKLGHKLKDRKGEQRSVIRFLFLPKSFNSTVRWLEMAEIIQHVVKVNNIYKWKSIDFKK